MNSRYRVSSLLVTLFIGVAACTQTADLPFGPSSPDDPLNPPVASLDFAAVPDLTGHTLYALADPTSFSRPPTIRQVDPIDGSTIDMLDVTLDDEVVFGADGLATQPGTNKLFALLRVAGEDGSVLVTIDPADGAATRVGNTGYDFASLAFSCDGVLHGVTPLRGFPPPPVVFLYSFNTNDAAATLELPVYGGNFGDRALAFNADDDLMYYLVLEKLTEKDLLFSVDLETGDQILVPKDNFIGEPASAVFVSEDVMLAASSFQMFTLSLDGARSDPEFTGYPAKGLALVPSFCAGAIEVLIMIKPGSEPNPVNTKSKGKLPVAILTTEEFDAATVNPATVTIGDGEGDETPVAMRKNGTLMANLEDVDDDGDLDMILHFNTPDIEAAGDLDETTTSLILNGLTTDDQAIFGSDVVLVLH